MSFPSKTRCSSWCWSVSRSISSWWSLSPSIQDSEMGTIPAYLIDRHHMNGVVNRILLEFSSLDGRELQVPTSEGVCVCLWVSRWVQC